jgi:hypothetical protein
MPQLSDGEVQRAFAGPVVEIYNRWNALQEFQRRVLFEQAIRAPAPMCGVPMPALSWGTQGGWFDYSQWRLTVDLRATTLDPHTNPIRAWLYFGTMPYHEMRHCEQFFLMAQAMLSGAVTIPAGPRGRGVKTTRTVDDVIALGYPRRIVENADRVKGQFAQGDIAMVRAWVDSIFGRGSRARGQTLNHLGRGGKHFNPYIHLPEEADAWRVEREVSRMIRQMIGAQAMDGALGGLGALFG